MRGVACFCLEKHADVFVLCLFVLAFAACSADKPLNPSFPLTLSEAQRDLERMRDDPLPLERPVIVIAGYLDPGIAVRRLRRRIAGAFEEPEKIITISLFGEDDFDECRRRVIERVQGEFPSDDPRQTVEVDVIGVSMGGLVARDAAIAREGETRLNIARLFTISTPFRGARLAGLPTLDDRVVDMRSGSEFLQSLDNGHIEPAHPVYPYVRLRDSIVGAPNAAPNGSDAWWVANIPFEFAHIKAYKDPRILADIARRLRGEAPFTTAPAAPLPDP